MNELIELIGMELIIYFVLFVVFKYSKKKVVTYIEKVHPRYKYNAKFHTILAGIIGIISLLFVK